MTGGLVEPRDRAVMSPSTEGAPAPLPADLRLTAVSAHGWRIAHGRDRTGRPGRVLAFIELQRDGFEVMQFGDGFECETFGSLLEAVDHVCATAARRAAEQPAQRRPPSSPPAELWKSPAR